MQPNISLFMVELTSEAAKRAIGHPLGARVAPVGLAWKRALEIRPDFPLHSPDKVHPSFHGTYLTACVLVAVYWGEVLRGVSNGGMKAIAADQKGFLQSVAWESVIAHQGERRQGFSP